MTKKQKVQHFQSDRSGKSAVDKVNEFISKPKIKAISISMSERGGPIAISFIHKILQE